jgi:glycosyltransferase involved in cell wall biosynthesis
MESSRSADVRVSFIVPALNVEATLPACLDAIWATEPRTLRREILVIDNGSTDRTAEIACDRGARVISAPAQSVAALRNLGARAARSDILACVDADCVIAGDWLGKAVAHFDDATVGAVGAATQVPANGTWVQRTWALPRHRRSSVQVVDWLPTENLVLRRAAFEATGGFNEALPTCEDVDLCYRLGQRYRILSDPALRSVHLGEAPTLRRFFRKEMWRGRGNLAGLRAHRFRLAEVPSVLLPLHHLFWMLAFVGAGAYAAAGGPAWPVIVSAMLLLLPSVVLGGAVGVQVGRVHCWPRLTVLYLTYGAARAAALLPDLRRPAKPTPRAPRPSPAS